MSELSAANSSARVVSLMSDSDQDASCWDKESAWQFIAGSSQSQCQCVEKGDPALDESPEENLNTVVKTSNVQLQHLQLLSSQEASLFFLETSWDHLLELDMVAICFGKSFAAAVSSAATAISLASEAAGLLLPPPEILPTRRLPQLTTTGEGKKEWRGRARSGESATAAPGSGRMLYSLQHPGGAAEMEGSANPLKGGRQSQGLKSDRS
uniref:Uncharacterized protein n=1 Tax=Oryza glumipatula TaxID=40148 RepID=A0A0E0AYP1_9ORYZ